MNMGWYSGMIIVDLGLKKEDGKTDWICNEVQQDAQSKMVREARTTKPLITCMADKRKQIKKGRRKLVRATGITQEEKVFGEGLLQEAETGKGKGVHADSRKDMDEEMKWQRLPLKTRRPADQTSNQHNSGQKFDMNWTERRQKELEEN